ncbi:MAG: class I SAM-dependent methyltransferase [Pseudomonadota bacterium]
MKRDGHRPLELPPMMLECCPNDNYALLDSGDGQKLERYGDFILQRPEAQAIWSRQRSEAEWAAADAIFTGGSDDDSDGRWHFPKKKLHETWRMTCDGLPYLGRFTAFRHVGVFAEQIVHWRHMRELIEGSDRQLKVLNLFGYTGLASLIAADAGAHVTHVDASKKAIGWARENQDLAGLNERPIRWICEDALKFVQREIRRGNTYDIILADPPAYGRGPNGEVWQLFENLGALVDGCRDILSTQPSMFVLTTYAIRASFFAAHELVMDAFTGFTPHGEVQSGELILREERTGRGLSTSMYTRWTPLTETAKS